MGEVERAGSEDKSMKIMLTAFLLVLSQVALADEAQTLAKCPPEGDAVQAEARALNPLKRRMTLPQASDVDPKATLEAMLAPGDDRGRWSEQRAAQITAYVMDVKVGGIESVNCHTHSAAYRDTHIELTAGGSSPEPLIVEVTPQWRVQHPEWTTPELKRLLVGHWVRFTGWLMFDAEHAAESRNTCSRCSHVWRASSWELHPVSAIEVVR
jgi:hypothetical protein